MKRVMTAALVTALLTSPAFAQQPTRAYNAKLGWLGVAAVGAGVALMVPWPEGENWELFGEDVCVIEDYQKFDVQRGSCATWEPLITAGAITAGVGAVLMIVGFHRVSVQPATSWNGGKSIGAKATVRW